VAEAVALARDIASRPGLSFAGFMLYPPESAVAETQAFLDAAKAGVREHGLEPRIVSSGGTPNLVHLGKIKGVTEHRAGTSVFNDRMMLAAGVAQLEDCALTVYATVVSRAGPERGILDSGSKTLTYDTGGLEGHGLILEHPQAKIARFAEEHGFLDLSACNDRPSIGDVVRIVPNHVCVVVNMVDRLVAVRGDAVVGELPVAARGRLT
jgi:D-serine deaminase-like pyridoxal phosphate-dependent protein